MNESIKRADIAFKALQKAYKQASEKIESKLALWRARFEDAQKELSLLDAQRQMTDADYHALNLDLDAYTKKARRREQVRELLAEAKNKADFVKLKCEYDFLSLQLEEASSRYHVSRLEALNFYNAGIVSDLAKKETALFSKHLKDVYTDTAKRSMQQIHLGTMPDKKTIEKALYTPWTLDNHPFYDRIWDKCQKLGRAVKVAVAKNVMTTEGIRESILAFKEEFRLDLGLAKRLIYTETAYMHEKANTDFCKNIPVVKEFEIVVGIDEATCDECAPLDGTHIKKEDAVPGINCPPFHPNCRCTKAPIIDEDYIND